MGFNEFLSSIFGNKSTRDMKEIQPWVEKIKPAFKIPNWKNAKTSSTKSTKSRKRYWRFMKKRWTKYYPPLSLL